MNFVFNYGQLLNTAGTICDERYHIRPLPGMDLLRTKTVHEVVSKRWHNLLLYFTVLLYFLLAMLLFPHAFGNKLLYSNYIGL